MALARDRSEATPPPDSAPPGVRGTWLADELQRALARIDALTRSLEVAHGALQTQQEEIARLTDVVRTVDGRTQRHETGQEIAREVRQEVATLGAALEAEASLRRDLAGRVERAGQREHATQGELRRVLEQIATRLDASEARQAATFERDRHLTSEIAEQERGEQSIEERLEALERQIAIGQDASRAALQELTRVGGALPELVTRLDELAARMRTAQVDQQHLAEDVAAVRAVRDREEALLDVLEQQRSTRARLEDRLQQAEEAIEAVRRAHAELLEQVTLTEREHAGDAEAYRALLERIEAQRDLLAEHVRRTLRAGEDAAQRRIEEIEREVRVARGLLVRLEEQAGDATQEPPL